MPRFPGVYSNKGSFCTVNGSCLLPGLLISKGEIHVDAGKFLYRGDLLHEAGHIAVALKKERSSYIGLCYFPHETDCPKYPEMKQWVRD